MTGERRPARRTGRLPRPSVATSGRRSLARWARPASTRRAATTMSCPRRSRSATSWTVLTHWTNRRAVSTVRASWRRRVPPGGRAPRRRGARELRPGRGGPTGGRGGRRRRARRSRRRPTARGARRGDRRAGGRGRRRLRWRSCLDRGGAQRRSWATRRVLASGLTRTLQAGAVRITRATSARQPAQRSRQDCGRGADGGRRWGHEPSVQPARGRGRLHRALRPRSPDLPGAFLVSDTFGGLLSIALLVALLAAAYVPLGDYMARVYTSTRHLRAERAVYRLSGVNPDAEQGARSYATSVVGFSLVGIVVADGDPARPGRAADGPRPAGCAVLDVVQHRGLLRHQHQLAVLRR